jgi:beta-barrel assembly-enhancing protease
MATRIAGLLRRSIALAALALAACASLEAPHRAGAGSTAPKAAGVDPAAVEASMADARRFFDQERFEDGEKLLVRLVELPSFGTLPALERYRALELAGRAELALGRKRKAYAYLARASAFHEATFDDVALELRTADQLDDASLKVATLTRLITRWPERLADVKDEYIERLLMAKTRLPHGATLPLLEALYAAHWKMRWGVEPSGDWRDLTLLLLERHRLDEAIDVASHAIDPYILISMRADRRFDPVTAANPQRFDVAAAQNRWIELLQSKDGAGTKSLEVKDMLIDALIAEQRYEVALAIADSVADDIRSTNYPERLYVDYEAEHADFLHERALVLEHLGRWDDALTELTRATPMFERGRDNVSAVIELGQLYCDLGHPGDGLRTINGVGASLSAFGLMQAQAVLLDAASQLDDPRQVKRSLDYLREHRSDGVGSYLWALLALDRADTAAAELITELRDADERADALIAVQEYPPAPGTPRELERYARWRSLIARADVQAEIKRVGRVDRYPLEVNFR